MNDEHRITVENIQDELGFTVRWKVQDHWADVEVFEVAAFGDDGREYLIKDWAHSGELTADIDNAEIYLEGYVKWDGCTELDQGRPHWCGPDGYKRHIALLEYIYKRAFELMGREQYYPWEDK